MSANTHLLDFSVDPAALLRAQGTEDFLNFVVGALETYLGGEALTTITRGTAVPAGDSAENDGTVSLFLGPRGSIITIRTYGKTGLITINLEYYLREGQVPLLTLENTREFGSKVEVLEGFSRFKSFPPIRRGAKIDVYMTTTDERLLEYDIDQIIYDERSQFQHIQIVHSLNFGNLLVLDDLQNLAESDLIYTESIMRRGVEDYAGKEILILGGGDGALLHELLKESPKMVTMIEIDELVMEACKVHLRSACGDTLDNYKGDNHEIVVGDCVEFMLNCVQDGRKFDYVFADLTDIPISPTPQGEVWDFIKRILNLSFKVLIGPGKFMTHGNGSSSPGALKMYEDVLEQLDEAVTFSRTNAFVPSFMEDWVFYQVARKAQS